MSQNYSITEKAYAKLILHCCKYPHLSVNGVVVGSISKESQTVQIQDAIPLFHSGIGLAPMLEVALTQIEIYVLQKGLSIVGHYHANELLMDTRISDTVNAISSKIAQHCDKACLLMVENAKLTDAKSKHALKVYAKKDQLWKEQTANFKLQDQSVLVNTLQMVDNRMFEQLVDFDNHLDNPQLDWTNPDINEAATRSTSSVQDLTM